MNIEEVGTHLKHETMYKTSNGGAAALALAIYAIALAVIEFANAVKGDDNVED